MSGAAEEEIRGVLRGRRARAVAARVVRHDSARGPKLGAPRGVEDARGVGALLARLEAAAPAGQEVEGLRDLRDDVAPYRRGLGGEAREQGVVAEVVYLARDALGAAEDEINRRGAEDVCALGARGQEARGDVALGFVDVGERPDLAAQRDALLELAQLRLVENVA